MFRILAKTYIVQMKESIIIIIIIRAAVATIKGLPFLKLKTYNTNNHVISTMLL